MVRVKRATTIPFGSRVKRLEAVGTPPVTTEGDDIVWSAMKVAGVHKRTGREVAHSVEQYGGDYGQYLKKLMLHYVAKSSKQVIFLAHTADVMNETDMIMETMVKVKGSVMNTGVESFFSTVLACKKMPLAKLKAYNNPLLVITPDDELLGYKYVFQTKLTKETVNERIRSSMGMWNQQETFIDNDAQLVLNRLREYYD